MPAVAKYDVEGNGVLFQPGQRLDTVGGFGHFL